MEEKLKIIDFSFSPFIDPLSIPRLFERLHIQKAFVSKDASGEPDLNHLKNHFPQGPFLYLHSFNPHKEQFPLDGLSRYMEKLPIKGVKLYPGEHWFFPGEPSLYPLYRFLADKNLFLVFQLTPSGALPFKLKYTDPLLIDEIASDFPSLRIVLSIGEELPWLQRIEFLTKSREHVYIELSLKSPQYIPLYFPSLEKIPQKFLFGSGMESEDLLEKRVREFISLPYSKDIIQSILYRNAEALLS